MDTLELSPLVAHKTQLFSSGLFGGPDLKPVMTWGRSSFGTGKKTLSIVDMPVFRSGTFRDSWGIQTTWEDTHIDQMVFNFDHLVNTKVLEKVPVRKGHGSFIGDPMETLIGWHMKLSAKEHQSPVDGAAYNYLLADFEIFDEEAAEHIFEGHWPNRSAEVGHYVTNAEAEHWPVYQGFAFVDIPAVEGLNAFSKAIDSSKSVAIFMEGNAVANKTPKSGTHSGDQTDTTTPDDGTAAPETPTPSEPETPTPSEPEAPAEPETPTDPQAPEESDPVIPPAATHGHSAQVGTFTIGGRATSDPAEVQNYINSLETAANEAVMTNRADFVRGLAEGDKPKIAATQIDELTSFAQGLTPEQYTAWSASYESAPALSMFDAHGADQGDKNGTPSNSKKFSQDEIDSAKVILQLHRSRNMAEDSIKKTESYQKLHAALPDEYPL